MVSKYERGQQTRSHAYMTEAVYSLWTFGRYSESFTLVQVQLWHSVDQMTSRMSAKPRDVSSKFTSCLRP